MDRVVFLQGAPAGFAREQFPLASELDFAGRSERSAGEHVGPMRLDVNVRFVAVGRADRVSGGGVLDVAGLLAGNRLQLKPFHDARRQRKLMGQHATRSYGNP